MVWRIFGKTAGGVVGRRDRTVGEAIVAALLSEFAERRAPDDANAAAAIFDQALRSAERDTFGRSLTELQGRFSRVWLDFVLRHDVIPLEQQVDDEVLSCAREMVAAFSAGSNSTRAIARKLLKHVDAGFQDGRLLASEALLSLFDAEPETRRDNERNILVERIARQTQTPRTRTVSGAQLASFRELISEHQDDPEVAMTQSLRWLREHAEIDFNLLMTSAPERKAFSQLDESWQAYLKKSTRQSFPPCRYRSLERLRDPSDALRRALPGTNTRAAVIHLLTLCWYLAATGTRHDFDDLLFDLEPWVQEHLGSSLPSLLSDINKAARDPGSSVADAAERAVTLHWKLNEPQLLSADHCARLLADLPMRLRDLDLNAVPPGAYDIQAFLCDQLLVIPHRRRSRALRLARLL